MTYSISPGARRWMRLTLTSFGIPLVSAAALIYCVVHITQTTVAIQKTRNDLALFDTKYESLDRLKTDYARVGASIPKLEAAVPLVDNFPIVSDYINSIITKTSNVATVRFDAAPKPDEAPFMDLSFSMRATGNLETIRNLLKELGTAPYFIEVRNVALTFAQGISGHVDADIQGAVYLRDSSL